jgi:hypothetical protein
MQHDYPAPWQALHELRHRQLLQEAEEWRLLRQGQRRPSGPRWYQRLAAALGDLFVGLGSWLKGLERPVL